MYTTELDQISRALDAAARDHSARYLRRRHRTMLGTLLLAALLALSVSSALAGVGPLAALSRSKAVSVVDRVDHLNDAIKTCMVAHGAQLTTSAGDEGLIDPAGNAATACADTIDAENRYFASPAYVAFEADQIGRGQAYADCMNAAGYAVPGWNGADGNATQLPPTADRTAASDRCADAAGLIRRRPDGTGVATPGSP